MSGIRTRKDNGQRPQGLADGQGSSDAAAGLRVDEDRGLVDRCVAGDANAWEELYSRYHDGLQATVRVWLGSGHSDPNLVDEIVARVWYAVVVDGGELLGRFDPARGCRLSTFLGSIAKGVAASFCRSERRRRRRERLGSRVESSHEWDFAGWTSGKLREFVAELTPAERGFLTGYLLSPTGGSAEDSISAENRWQLQSRIGRKLRRYVAGEP